MKSWWTSIRTSYSSWRKTCRNCWQTQRSDSYGDLSENAEYQAARDEQAQVELRIAELEEMLKPGGYEIIDEKKKKTGINVGSVVTLEETERKETITYTIVGSQEASILDGKISNESPIGRALIGKNTGDTITVLAPSGKTEYSILKVI